MSQLQSPALTAHKSKLTTPDHKVFPLSSVDDRLKRQNLRKMRTVATVLLIVAAIIFLTARFLESRGYSSWISYLRAAAEAGMVGGLADWFAVTALFKYPLGLKIPHTAIIRQKKDQIGESLAGFVESNFITPDNVAEKIGELQLPRRVGEWLQEPGNSDRLAAETARVGRMLADAVSDEDIEQLINSTVIEKISEPQWGPILGRFLTRLLDDGRHLPVIDTLIDRAYDWSINSGEMIDRVVDTDMPRWAPKFVNNLVGYKIHDELVKFTGRVQADPDHDLRKSLSRFLYDLAHDLQFDQKTIDKTEQIKTELLSRKEIKNAAHSTWSAVKSLLDSAIEDPHNSLRIKFGESAANFGNRLVHDEELVHKIDDWVDQASRTITTNYSSQIITIITDTIERWDSEDASKKIELQVGRDLQFIRINGTVVGAIAGLVIYTISQIILSL